jgi:hypothetical protein
MDEVTPLVFKIGDTQVQVKNDEKSIKLVTEFMTKNTPKMDEYFHQDWTEETFTKVAEAIVAAVPQREVLEMILERSKDTKMNELIRSKMKPGKSNAPKASVNDDLEFASTPSSTDSTVTESPVESTAGSEDDEYDSLFSNL